MTEQDWTPDRFYTYEFSNGNDIVTLVIPTMSDWSDETVNDVAFGDLATHLEISQYEAHHGWWEHDSRLSTAEDMETMGGVYSTYRNPEVTA